MKKFLLLCLIIYQPVKSICQKVELNSLVKAYNSKSLVSALSHLSDIPVFKGNLHIGINLSDSSIRGIIGIDSLFAIKQRGKITIYHIFHELKEFQDIKNQATKSLYSQEVYIKESNGINREHYVFSNVPKMKDGDLEFIITRCVSTDGKNIYYQLDLSAHGW